MASHGCGYFDLKCITLCVCVLFLLFRENLRYINIFNYNVNDKYYKQTVFIQSLLLVLPSSPIFPHVSPQTTCRPTTTNNSILSESPLSHPTLSLSHPKASTRRITSGGGDSKFSQLVPTTLGLSPCRYLAPISPSSHPTRSRTYRADPKCSCDDLGSGREDGERVLEVGRGFSGVERQQCVHLEEGNGGWRARAARLSG